jgi:hypothetical protein
MCVVVASTPDEAKEGSRVLVSSILNLTSKLWDVWAIQLGGINNEQMDTQELMGEVDSVTESGKALDNKTNRFGQIILEELLASIPPMYSEHFAKIVDSNNSFARNLPPDDAEYICRTVIDEQTKEMRELVESIVLTTQDDSRQFIKACDWVKAGKEIFDAAEAGGFTGVQAMEKVIKTIGFPVIEDEK